MRLRARLYRVVHQELEVEVDADDYDLRAASSRALLAARGCEREWWTSMVDEPAVAYLENVDEDQ